MDMNAVPSGDPGGVAVAPGQEGMAGGQAGVVREVDPVVADADQGEAVGYQAGAGGGIGDEGSVGAVAGVQVRDGRAVLRSGGRRQGCEKYCGRDKYIPGAGFQHSLSGPFRLSAQTIGAAAFGAERSGAADISRCCSLLTMDTQTAVGRP